MHFLLQCDLWKFGLIMVSCLRPSYRQALCIDPICISELKLDVFTHILIIQLRFHTSSPFCFGCEYVHLSVCLWSLSPVVSFVLVVAEISRCMLYRFLRFVQANQTIKGSNIFTGTKTLHLRCVSREDRSAWIESLLAAKELFPRVLSSNDFAPAEDVVVSTEKLRLRLLQEGIGEAAIKDCESVMLLEVSELQNKLKTLHYKHVMLLETLRQLEVFVLLPFSFLVHYTLLKQSLKSYCGCLRI